MEKIIRKATKCFLIKENKIVAIQYKKGNKKEGYYDIPGGKIEEGETAKQAAIREMKEEIHKGLIIIEYPTRKITFEVFVTNTYEGGEPQEFEDNTSRMV